MAAIALRAFSRALASFLFVSCFLRASTGLGLSARTIQVSIIPIYRGQMSPYRSAQIQFCRKFWDLYPWLQVTAHQDMFL